MARTPPLSVKLLSRQVRKRVVIPNKRAGMQYQYDRASAMRGPTRNMSPSQPKPTTRPRSASPRTREALPLATQCLPIAPCPTRTADMVTASVGPATDDELGAFLDRFLSLAEQLRPPLPRLRCSLALLQLAPRGVAASDRSHWHRPDAARVPPLLGHASARHRCRSGRPGRRAGHSVQTATTRYTHPLRRSFDQIRKRRRLNFVTHLWPTAEESSRLTD